MQRAKRFCNSAIIGNRFFFLHLFVILLLWALAFWNLSYLLDEYFNNNRHTLVTHIEINEKFPFLSKIQICIEYKNTILSLIRHGEPNEDVLNHRSNYMEAVEKYENFSLITADEKIIGKLTFDDLIDGLVLFEKIRDLDLDSLACVVGGKNTESNVSQNQEGTKQNSELNNEQIRQEKISQNSEANNEQVHHEEASQNSEATSEEIIQHHKLVRRNSDHGIIATEEHSHNPSQEHSEEPTQQKSACKALDKYQELENIFKNGHLEELWYSLWINFLKPNIVRAIGDKIDNSSLIYYNLDRVCFSIALDRDLSINKPSATYAVGLIGEEAFINETKEIGEARAQIFFQDYQSPNLDLDFEKKLTKINVQIKNNGLYDKKITTKCSNDNIESIDFEATNDFQKYCRLKKYLQQIFENCQCVPFSYKNFFGFQNSETTYCSVEKYKNCLSKVESSISNEPCLPFCTVSKNDYQLLIDQTSKEEFLCYENLCSPIFLTFQCSDKSYLFYEEKYQFSCVRLLAEIGGLLCFYTGFSILGLWRLLSCFCNLRRRRRKALKESSHVGVVPSWPALMVRHMQGRTAEIHSHHEVKQSNDRILRDVELRMQTMQNDISSISVGLGKSQSDIWNVEQLVKGAGIGVTRKTKRLQRRLWRQIDEEVDHEV